MRLYNVEFPCTRNGLRPALHLELAVDRVDIPFHRTQRDHKPVRNFTIGVARDDQTQHRQLAFAQRFAQRVNVGHRKSFSGTRHVLVMRSNQQCQEVFSIARGASLISGWTTAHLHQKMRYRRPLIHKEADVALRLGKGERLCERLGHYVQAFQRQGLHLPRVERECILSPQLLVIALLCNSITAA